MKYIIEPFKNRAGIEQLDKCAIWCIHSKGKCPIFVGKLDECMQYIQNKEYEKYNKNSLCSYVK